MPDNVKMWHDKNKRVEHEGHVWHLDIACWRSPNTGTGVLRVYKVHGDVNTAALSEALNLLAAAEGLTWAMELGEYAND